MSLLGDRISKQKLVLENKFSTASALENGIVRELTCQPRSQEYCVHRDAASCRDC
ncbi:hypothetical protein LIA77_08272 [Sarocladium implicatum]|nr:hypothetical protein LIA77_08272 [Sarocladium implicatum]